MSATSKTKNDEVMRYPQDRQQDATRVLNNIQISRPVTVDIIHNRGGIAWDFRREHDWAPLVTARSYITVKRSALAV